MTNYRRTVTLSRSTDEDYFELANVDKNQSKLMSWIRTIDILQHVEEDDIPRVFSDGVLFMLLLKELFEDEQIPDALSSELLPTENYPERLHNWRLLNENVLVKLNLSLSDGFLKYIAREKQGYIEELLQSVQEIAPHVRECRSSPSPPASYRPDRQRHHRRRRHRVESFYYVEKVRRVTLDKESRYLHPLDRERNHRRKIKIATTGNYRRHERNSS